MPKATTKTKPAAAKKPAAATKPAAAEKCIALDVGHRSCPCPDCSYNAPKK